MSENAGNHSELASLLFEALNRADSARQFGRSMLGVGMVKGQMSIGCRNDYLRRKERVCFDTSIVVIASDDGILEWGFCVPENLHDLAALIHEQGTAVLDDLAERRGKDKSESLLEIGGEVLKALSGLGMDLQEHARCIVH